MRGSTILTGIYSTVASTGNVRYCHGVALSIGVQRRDCPFRCCPCMSCFVTAGRPNACWSAAPHRCLLAHRYINPLLLLQLKLVCLLKCLPRPQVRHSRHRHCQHLSEPQACSFSGQTMQQKETGQSRMTEAPLPSVFRTHPALTCTRHTCAMTRPQAIPALLL